MKTKLAILGVLGMLLFVFYMESEQEAFHHPSSLLLDPSDDAEEVSSTPDDHFETSVTTFDYVYEQTKDAGDYRVEFYQEYEVVLDEEGREIRRKPTGEYEHLRYKK